MLTDQRTKANKLSQRDFEFICKFVYENTGIVLNESKREMVYRRLTRITRDRKLSSFNEYCQLLKSKPEQERDYFVNAITTNLTSFFRENHHFEFLGKKEFPALLQQNNNSKRIRIWSSACSTGEEPYSIAITVHEHLKHILSHWDVKILATDIDSNVVETAKAGVYNINRVEDVPRDIEKRYFVNGTGANQNKVKVQPKLQELITFKQLNLMHEWPMKGVFDIIFCRNVIIYFDKQTQEDLFARYYEQLKPGGLLLLGHSESLGRFQKYFENVGRTIFRKPL